MKFKIFTLTAVMSFALSSCHNDWEDGRWEAMKWKVEKIEGNVKVEPVSDGLMKIFIFGEGSLDIECLNYYPWISPGTYYPQETDVWDYYENEWLTVRVDNKIVHCEFSNPPEEFHKEINVDMTAGDIFFLFNFVREEDFGPSGKWAPINFELQDVEGEVEMEKLGNYATNILVDGECSFNLVCTNYADIWFMEGIFTSSPLEDIYNVGYEWCQLHIEENVIHCDIYDWDKEAIGGCDFKVSAGEIMNNLYLYQKSVINR